MNISVEDWFDYLDDCATQETRRRVESAIASHPPARSVYDALRYADLELRREARALHQAHELPPRDVNTARSSVLSRVNTRASLSADRLARIEAMLKPWCGQRVAAGLVLAAVARSSQESAHTLWPAFLDHAASLTAALCGNAAGQLVAEFGRTVV